MIHPLRLSLTLLSLTLLLTMISATTAQDIPLLIEDSSLLTASYFGQDSNEIILGSAIATNGNLVLVGRTDGSLSLNGSQGNVTYGNTSAGNGGFIAIFNQNGTELLYSAVFAPGTATVEDVVLNDQDALYISGIGFAGFADLINGSGSFDTTLDGDSEPYMAQLSADAQTLIWGSFQPGGTAISLLSGDRPVAGAESTTVAVLSADGTQLVETFTTDSTPSGGNVEDMIADPTNDHIYLVGFHQVSGNLQTPFLEAYRLGSPDRLWRAYRKSASEINAENLGADSGGVALGLDTGGDVLAIMDADGGNTVLSRDPFDLSVRIGNTILEDAYQNGYGQGGGPKVSFIGRYDPDNGALLDGSFLYGTLTSNGNTNTTSAEALAVDGQNRVYVAGSTACCFPSSRAEEPLSPHRFVENYAGGESFLAIFSPDLDSLEFGSYMGGSAVGEKYFTVAVSENRAIVAGQTSADGALTRAPFQTAYGGGDDGLLAVLATVPEQEPTIIVDAGDDQQVTGGDTVTLQGSGSGAERYEWTQLVGGTVALSPTDELTTTFVAPNENTTLTFQLAGIGADDTTVTDTVDIEVQVATVTVDAGPDQRVLYGAETTLSGSGDNVDTFAWRQTDGMTVTLDTPDQAETSFTAPMTTTTLMFELVGTGFSGSRVATDTVEVQVGALTAAATATPEQALPGATVQLDGRDSQVFDPIYADGLMYAWSQPAGQDIALSATDVVTPTFTVPAGQSDDLTFTLTVTSQSLGASATADVTVTIGSEQSYTYLPLIRR
ncbi:MAG: hypothetical protein HC837_06695 [Chloroflexaceae bacterium]|nr:hypothetical protein [Chloroflexaceae bacterium]